MLAKSNFRNGGANLRVCLDSRQGIATISEITFGKHYRSGFTNLEAIFYRTKRMHADNIEDVEDISPRLPESARATLGAKPLNPSLSRVARRAQRVSRYRRIKPSIPSLFKDFSHTSEGPGFAPSRRSRPEGPKHF
jgi:hypothetical protein